VFKLVLKGKHPVSVSQKGVYLAVMGKVSKGLCQVPVGKGVGGISLMKEAKPRG